MPVEFSYKPEADNAVYLRDSMQVHGHDYDMSVGTVAGRKNISDIPKSNEDAFSIVSYDHGLTAAVFRWRVKPTAYSGTRGSIRRQVCSAYFKGNIRSDSWWRGYKGLIKGS